MKRRLYEYLSKRREHRFGWWLRVCITYIAIKKASKNFYEAISKKKTWILFMELLKLIGASVLSYLIAKGLDIFLSIW
ncbi:hypothetical protein [Butyrivibrio proteoclasticus]|uniref:hypothetical protein n=1 Tax=Butyrivibrio proteoclasticus TaxID=43305 RepID=UPI00047DC672|nr:hypothetical protein [Butyrivibrio proteoclasticus]